MNRSFSLVFLLLLGVSCTAFAQKGKKGKGKNDEDDKLANAEYFFEENNFLRAQPLFKELANEHPDKPYYKYRLGICDLYKSDEADQAVVNLEAAQKAQPDLDYISFYLGRAYHLNDRFDDAIAQFTKTLDDKKISSELKDKTQHYIEYCNHAKDLTRAPLEVEIKSIGSPINTANAEYVPVITADESMLIYTYKGERSTGGLQNLKFEPDPDGEYYEDVFYSQRVGEYWLSPEPIGTPINTKGHDASIALSNDGQILFMYKSTPGDRGDIFMSKLRGDNWSAPVRLDKNINTKQWEGSCSLSGDGKVLYFASERPGGFGGRDIYIAHQQSDGSWGQVENLGPTINTKWNDDAPFIHPDGITLFFSSEGHNSMGGYDIMYSQFKDGKWSEPTNMGSPINTTGDERFYVLSADGATGYFSSDRKGGNGQQDIYTVSPGFTGEPPILALVVGIVTLDQKPVDATINITNDETGSLDGTYHTNSSSGKYIIALKPGNKYKIAIEVEGQDTYYEYVNVKGLDTYVQINKDFNFQSQANGQPASVVADTNDVLQKKLDTQIQRIREEQKNDVYEAKIYKNVIKKYGDVHNDSTGFMLELGTYQDPKDFDSTKVSDLGRITKRIDENGNTTFALGPFKTLLDAELFKNRLVGRDSMIFNNATVTVNDNGKRKLVQQYYRKEYTRKGYEPPLDTRVIKSKQGTLETTIDNGLPYDKLLQDYGTFQATGLSYKLELASVKDTNDFKLNYLAKYGKIEKKYYPDGTIRYSMGPFTTLKEAEDFKQMLIEKEPEASKSIVTVFYFGEKKSLSDIPKIANPCDNKPVDLSWFMGKSLNDPAVYAKFLTTTGNYCRDGLIYKVQIGAYRHPDNFKYSTVEQYGPAEIVPYPDGITRFTLKQFTTIKEAEAFRQTCIQKGVLDAWITAVYKGERKTLEELIRANFYGAQIQ